MDNTRNVRPLATSFLPAGKPCGPQEQRAQRHAPLATQLGQRNEHWVRTCVYIAESPVMAAATFAGMSGPRTWSPPV